MNHVFKKSVLALLILATVTGTYALHRRYAGTEKMASALDRVEKSKVLRCGYWVFEPYVKKDPNTGKMSGITVDYLEQTAARQGLTVRWDSEVPIDQIVPSLESGRFDMFCVPCSPMGDWIKRVDFVGSFGKLPYYLYVPAQSTKSLDELQTSRFSVIDGYITSEETPAHFPKATITSLPNMAPIAELYDQLKYGKADAVLIEHVSALNYMKNNPGVIRRFDDKPLFMKAVSFLIEKGDVRWGKFVGRMTDTTPPDNKALFESLARKYGLTENAITPD